MQIEESMLITNKNIIPYDQVEFLAIDEQTNMVEYNFSSKKIVSVSFNDEDEYDEAIRSYILFTRTYYDKAICCQ